MTTFQEKVKTESFLFQKQDANQIKINHLFKCMLLMYLNKTFSMNTLKKDIRIFVLICVSLCIYREYRLSWIFAHCFYYNNHRHPKVQAGLN